MKITVAFLDDAARVAEVLVVPTARSRGGARSERVVRAVRGAAGCWLHDSSGRRVTDRRVIAELERRHDSVGGCAAQGREQRT